LLLSSRDKLGMSETMAIGLIVARARLRRKALARDVAQLRQIKAKVPVGSPIARLTNAETSSTPCIIVKRYEGVLPGPSGSFDWI